MRDAYIISLYEAFERIKNGDAPVFARAFTALVSKKCPRQVLCSSGNKHLGITDFLEHL